MIDPRTVKSPEQKSYESYVAMCRRLHVQPMDFQDWSGKFGKLDPSQQILGLKLKGPRKIVS